MARYSYLTIIVAICRDFDDDRHLDVIVSDNPVEILQNLIVENGIAIVEPRVVLGKVRDMANYMYRVKDDGEVKYRSCLVVRRFYLKLPRPMTRNEASKFIEEITGIKLPVKPGSEEERRLLAKIYEKLSKR